MTGWSRFWHGRRRGIDFRRLGAGFLAAGALVLALALALALFVGLTVDHPGNALAADGTTYASCAYAIANFPTDLGNVTSGSATFTFPANCTIDVTSALTVDAGVTVTLDGNGLTLDQTTSNADVINITDSMTSPSTLSLDQVTVEGGHIGIYEGMHMATVTLAQSTVRDNGDTGIDAGNVSLTQSTVSDNGNGVNGGPGGEGIYADRGSVTLTDSTVSDNGNSNADIGGYGIDALISTVSLTNSTVSDNGNGSNGGIGGMGIQGSTIMLADSTVSDNGGGGGYGIKAPTSFSLTASIVANPGTTKNCQGPTPADHGYNLSTDDSCGLKATGSQNNVGTGALNLQPLANNGGPTETQALGTGSLAIDAIPVNAQNECLDASGSVITDPTTGNPITTDQRGVNRPQGTGCDIGAYELIQGAATVTPGSCPTQAELQDDLNLGAQTNGKLLTINLPPNCTIDLTSSLTVGNGVNITINGNGLTLVGNGTATTSGTFDDIAIADATSSTTLALNQVTVERGASGIGSGGGGATVILTNSTVSDNGDDGISAATATVTDSTVSGNGLEGINAVTSTVTDSTVSGNGDGGINANDTTVTDSTISGNGSEGIYAVNSATVTASILAGNSHNCSVPFGLTDGGYNLSTDTSCGFSGTSQQESTVADGLNLLPLGNYGGPTQTIALGPGSIAIDQIPVGTPASIGSQTVDICPSPSDPAFTDQRGIPRPQGDKCDVGAYEAPALNLAVNPSSPNGSNGWYVTDPTVSLGYSGLAIGQDSTGAPQAQVATCTGLNGLSHTSTTLNDSGSVPVTVTSDGKYAITCGIEQGTTALGVSYTGPNSNAVPFDLNVDTTPPTITITTPAETSYTLHQTVDANYGCTDGTSGITTANCVGPVVDGGQIDTSSLGSHTFTVNATDNAGNTATKSVTYTVGYALTALPGSTTTVNPGYDALIRFAPEDANGHDYASRTLKVTSVELDGPGGQVIAFAYQFQYGTFSGKPGYQLALDTRSLAPGSWTLKVRVGLAQMTYSISFEVE